MQFCFSNQQHLVVYSDFDMKSVEESKNREMWDLQLVLVNNVTLTERFTETEISVNLHSWRFLENIWILCLLLLCYHVMLDGRVVFFSLLVAYSNMPFRTFFSSRVRWADVRRKWISSEKRKASSESTMNAQEPPELIECFCCSASFLFTPHQGHRR